MRTRYSCLAVSIVLCLVGVGCSLLGEVGELMKGGGEKSLREEMRPIRGTTRVLVIAFDGVSDEALREMLAAGHMPRLQALLGQPTGQDDIWANAYAAPNVATVLPAETAPGWAAVFTGSMPAKSGIAGNEWFDRTRLSVSAPVPLSVGTVKQTLQIYADELMGRLILTPTVFEQADLRSHVAMGFVYRGADLMNPPDLNDFDDLIQLAWSLLWSGPDSEKPYRVLDEDAKKGAIRSAQAHGLPDLQVLYFPGVDLTTHTNGHDAQQAYLRKELDRHIGEVIRLYSRYNALDDTYILVVADHGHTETLADETHSLADQPRAVFDSLGLRLRKFGIGVDSSAYDAVMTFNEAFGYVYLADRTTCAEPSQKCDWQEPPRLGEDVMPVVRAFHRANTDSTFAPGLTGTLDLILARSSRIDSTVVPFQVFDGDTLISVETYLARSKRNEFVRFQERLHWLVNGPEGHRAGDVVLLAKSGGNRPKEERYYFGSPRKSGHGSPFASDSIIPLMLIHYDQSGFTLKKRLHDTLGPNPSQLDITRLILSLLEEGNTELDGEDR